MRTRICVSLIVLSFLASMAGGVTASVRLVKVIGAQISSDFHADDRLTQNRYDALN